MELLCNAPLLLIGAMSLFLWRVKWTGGLTGRVN